MIKEICNCQKCNLCFNQRPLLDYENMKKHCQVFWVGLSAKRISDIELPLSPETNTGMIIRKIEESFNDVTFYKTNLVKCLPLTEHQKLRYPNEHEINCCFGHLLNEIHIISPKIIFLLGEKVYLTVEKRMEVKFDKWNGYEYSYKEIDGIYYIPLHHPSYIYVYKKKEIDNYICGVRKMIEHVLQ